MHTAGHPNFSFPAVTHPSLSVLVAASLTLSGLVKGVALVRLGQGRGFFFAFFFFCVCVCVCVWLNRELYTLSLCGNALLSLSSIVV